MRKESKDWFKVAREDLKSAKVLFREGLFRMVGFHSQQAVEKAFKALLTEKEFRFKRIHSLIDLKNNIEKIGYKISINEEEAVFLNSIYRSRYPADLGLLPQGESARKDAQKALNVAARILKEVYSLLK